MALLPQHGMLTTNNHTTANKFSTIYRIGPDMFNRALRFSETSNPTQK